MLVTRAMNCGLHRRNLEATEFCLIVVETSVTESFTARPNMIILSDDEPYNVDNLGSHPITDPIIRPVEVIPSFQPVLESTVLNGSWHIRCWNFSKGGQCAMVFKRTPRGPSVETKLRRFCRRKLVRSALQFKVRGPLLVHHFQLCFGSVHQVHVISSLQEK